MAFSNKLCNATPFLARIDWGVGQIIAVKPDAYVELSVRQMEDFLPSQPGAEGVQEILNYKGLFLEDSDLSYDVQALTAIQKAIRMREQNLDEHMVTLAGRRAQANMPNDTESLNQAIKTTGFSKLKEEIAVLKKRERIFSEAVSAEMTTSPSGRRLDPERTLFVMNPPQEFRSAAAMNAFLAEHPEVATKHKEFLKQQSVARLKAAKKAEESPANA